MKKYLIMLLLLSVTLLISVEIDNFKVIEYEKPIHGFKVKIYFNPPPKDQFSWSTYGFGIIEFTDINNGYERIFFTRSLKMPYDYYEEVKPNEETANKIEKTASDIITATYTKPNFKEDEDGWIHFDNISNQPFFFFDINYDGIDELFITEYRTAQRSIDYYRVYRLSDVGSGTFYLRDEPPYNRIDGYTSINIQEKIIRKHGSSGARSFENKIYKFEKIKIGYGHPRVMVDEYRLDEVIIGDYDDIRTYLIGDSKRTLISIEKWEDIN